jgi:hypothetical protein
MNFSKKAVAGIATGFALMFASAGCAGKKTAPEQQPGQAYYQQQQMQKQAFEKGIEACKSQQEAGVAATPTVTAQLTDPTGEKGCNCSCQTAKGGKASGSAEVTPQESAKSGKTSSYE